MCFVLHKIDAHDQIKCETTKKPMLTFFADNRHVSQSMKNTIKFLLCNKNIIKYIRDVREGGRWCNTTTGKLLFDIEYFLTSLTAATLSKA